MIYNNITDHIKENQRRMNDPMISYQARRHVEEELESLEKYHSRHPEDSHDPTSLELYCDDNPTAFECKIFDV
jgi:DNA-directed RNA polymerase specialized sigma subunit